MSDVLKPRDETEVAEAVAWAVGEDKRLEIVGRGSKRAIGRPAQADLTLDLSGLTGVTLYEPDELVLSARAGTPLAEIEDLLASHGQELAFEPMDYGPLLGQEPRAGSIGGTVAANLSGPRRPKAGAARDHFLGVTAVSGRGEPFKAGGRVVKNVTGYDLCKGLAGSWGTLAAMTDVTLKVLPRAEAEESVLVLGLDDAQAARAMALALGSPAEVSGAAHLPAPSAARAPLNGAAAGAVTALRLEGVAPSVAYRRDRLSELLQPFGRVEVIAGEASRALWRFVRDVLAFAGDARPVWRISVTPMQGPELVRRIRSEIDAEAFYDWGGGLIWVAVPPLDDAAEPGVRRAVRAAGGGHATLIRAAPAIRAAVPVFEPQPAPLAALTRRLKQSFDPKGVLNPGRMYPGV
ncbi:MAG: glycolate oxidase subunit GlcE [Pseudomonadota bacterium]|nr:glycolate oxidase subunit GlcE [Pseudomonadota bacterium]